MDNSFAEWTLRPSVIARKLSYGSKNAGRARLTSCVLSGIKTLRLNQVKVYDWLLDYLGACATNDSKVPSDLSALLPWQMERERFAKMQIGSGVRPQGP